MRLKKLIKDLPYKSIAGIKDCEIKGISCNSHSIRPGYLFVAVKGTRLDGHNFLNQAIERGAKAVIVQKSFPLKKKVGEIVVKDSQGSLAHLCAVFFGRPSERLKVIGITGTNGKTTVSYLLENILDCAGYRAGVVGTINYRVGTKTYPNINTTPQADRLQSFLHEIILHHAKYAIMEVSSHALAQGRVKEIDFSSAIFTNLSREHLDYHGNLSNYFCCKASLFERLSPSAWSIINIDDWHGRKLAKNTKAQLLTYAITHSAQIKAKDLVLSIARTKLTATTPNGELKIESPLIGRHNVYNILAAISAAFVEKIEFSDIAKGIRKLKAIPGRLESIDCGQDFKIFVDYAHTEDALKQVLQILRQISNNKIILVFGCGGDRDKTKRPKMGKVASRLSDFVIITTDNPRSEKPEQIISDILSGISKKAANCKVTLDRFQAIAQALSMAKQGDIVLIAGKGHESTQIFADRTVHFNDRKAVEQILKHKSAI